MAEEPAKLVRRRGALKAKLTTSINFLSESKENYENLTTEEKEVLNTELQLRMQKIEVVLGQFDRIQTSIELASADDDYDEQLEERDRFENSYFSHLAQLKQYLSSKTQHTDANEELRSVASNNSIKVSADVSANIRLPQIKLPSFSGAYENWLEFRDTYQSLIHNNDQLGEVQKFHYLRAALQDNAAQIIHALDLSDNNYKIAWDLLCERYDNKALLINTHVKQLFNLPMITKEVSTEFRRLGDQLAKSLRSLEVLEQPVHTWDTLVIYLINTKLDQTTIREWEAKPRSGIPTLHEMKEFLKAKTDLLETLELNQVSSASKKGLIQKFPQKTKAFATTSTQSCYICKGMHYIYNCQQFLKLTIPKRIEQVNSHKLCVKCLRAGHNKLNCKSGGCRKCGNMHNTLLHLERRQNEIRVGSVENEQHNGEREAAYSTTMATEIPSWNQGLLSTALVQVEDQAGNMVTCRALLDCGAQSNFMTWKLCKMLKLPTTPIQVAVTGISNITSNITDKCDISLQSMHYAFKTRMSCLVMKELVRDIPNFPYDIESLNLPKYIRLADPGFNRSAPVDMIIGAGLFWTLLSVGQQNLANNLLNLQKTRLGWIVTGMLEKNILQQQVRGNCAKTNELHNQLEKFWLMEETSSGRILTAEEIECNNIFDQTTKRTQEGRFIVHIPLKEPVEYLGDSKSMALQRFNSLERRFVKNTKLKKEYSKFMSEYIQQGHMTKIETNGRTDDVNYLPHHGVIKEHSSTTKLRVVFDGSAVTTSGYSFNDLQMVGKYTQDDLLTLIIRFRQHYYVICGDIEKMYRQILVDQQQRKLQCIIWRDDASQELESYTLNTVTYETASAPFLAIKCLRQIGLDHQQEYPEAAKAILTDFYVDDLMTGGDTEEGVLALAKEISELVKTGCFKLRKWISNSKNILQELQQDLEDNVVHFGNKEDNKTLGVYWSNIQDELFYKINTNSAVSPATKRSILSQIAQIFDPMGILSPVIINAKILIQELWACNIGWDETVSMEIYTKWK